ncbi:MAG: hypothetical protein R3352_08930, partial [Salinisphaeraceae bacterium]|nr:hypothetical protein [Salinisphaeraceae bacterium]
NKKLWILYIIFIDFVIFTGYVVYQEGYFGFLDLALGSLWGGQVFIDLVIALLLFLTWMLGDAKARGVTAWPYVVGTFCLGSIVPLWYLIRREHALLKQA